MPFHYDLKEIPTKLCALWDLLSEEEKQLFSESIRIQVYKKNEIIYHEGESPDNLLCLLEGKVKIYRDGVGGRSQIMRVMRPVQYFGYRASLANEPYVTAAAAFEESVICIIPMRIVNATMNQNNALCRFFIQELATDLGMADRRTVSLTQKHVRGRLAEALLFLKDAYGLDDDGLTLGIHLSREDLANLSNMTTSNAIRTLSSFASEGLITINGRRIVLHEVDKLKRISHIG